MIHPTFLSRLSTCYIYDPRPPHTHINTLTRTHTPHASIPDFKHNPLDALFLRPPLKTSENIRRLYISDNFTVIERKHWEEIG